MKRLLEALIASTVEGEDAREMAYSLASTRLGVLDVDLDAEPPSFNFNDWDQGNASVELFMEHTFKSTGERPCNWPSVSEVPGLQA